MLNDVGTLKTIIIIMSLHGLFLAGLMAVGQLIVNKRSLKNLLYLDLFLIFGLLEVQMILFETGMLQRYPVLRHTGIPAVYALGPVMYFFARFSLEKDYDLQIRHFFHYLPPLAAFIAAISGQPDSPVMDGFFPSAWTYGIWSGGVLILFGYLAFIAVLFKKNYLLDRGAVLRSARAGVLVVVYFIMIVVGIFLAAASFLQYPGFIEIAMLCVTGVIIFMFMVNFRYPDYYQALHRAVEEEKRRRSYLTGLDSDDLLGRLQAAMDDEAYSDEEISLPGLAGMLGITTHQLSQLINENYGMNFISFINGKRIERARTLLLQDRESPVLSIAYEVGFKSKSSFNEVFKKFTGVTPTQYRRNH